MTYGGGADGGSVLVDALVAIGVMTLTMAFAAQTVGAGALRTRSGERVRMAGLEARSRMAEVGADIPLAPGSASGVDDDMTWKVDITPSATAAAGGSAPLLDVAVTVSGPGGERLARLNSLRLDGAS